MVPTGAEYSRVMAALEDVEQRGREAALASDEPEASAVLSG